MLCCCLRCWLMIILFMLTSVCSMLRLRILLLVGIVVTNAIVLIDLINQYREQGRELHDAIMNGARQRLRPLEGRPLEPLGLRGVSRDPIDVERQVRRVEVAGRHLPPRVRGRRRTDRVRGDDRPEQARLPRGARAPRRDEPGMTSSTASAASLRSASSASAAENTRSGTSTVWPT